MPFDFSTPDGYEFYLHVGPTVNLDKLYLKGSNPLFNDQLMHTTYDYYWKARDLSTHMKNIKCAVMVVGGWFDAEDLSGPFKTFHAIEQYNPGTPDSLVVGPWVHGGWASTDGDHLGDSQFAAKTSEFFRADIQFPFFEPQPEPSIYLSQDRKRRPVQFLGPKTGLQDSSISKFHKPRIGW